MKVNERERLGRRRCRFLEEEKLVKCGQAEEKNNHGVCNNTNTIERADFTRLGEFVKSLFCSTILKFNKG
jgi:hypothetical protein